MEDFKFYEVGGKVRDELLGLTNKDVDYVAVPSEELLRNIEEAQCLVDGIYPNTTNAVFTMLESHLRKEGFEIFLVTPDCYTIRAKFPGGYKYQGVADFVMARKEVGYVPGTRTPIVEPGNLYDDPLRILRAIRFAVTKRFTIEQTTWQAMVLYDYDSKMPVVSEERIREELIKCFRCNTIRTLTYLDYLPRLRDYIFSKTNLWLKPTNEK